MFVIEFCVTGSGHFPMDMLRYDQCFPESSSDVDKLKNDGKREIKLIRLAPKKNLRTDNQTVAEFRMGVHRHE